MTCSSSPQSAQSAARTLKHTGATMTTATRYALLASVLALITATPSFAQTRPGTAVDSGYPPYHCIPLKVDSLDELKHYCEGWRAIRKSW